MQDSEVAKRLIGYADAVVALSFVSISAFGLAVADPDIRCSLAGALLPVIIANTLGAALFSLALLMLSRWGRSLQADDQLSSRGRKISGYLNAGRHFLIWFAAVGGSLLVFMIDGSGCGA